MANPKYIPKYTFEDYKIWKGDWELIEGHPVSMSPSPNKKHQFIANEVNFLFQSFLKKNKQSCDCKIYYELDWKVKNNTILRPDLLIVCNDKDSDFIEQVPVLVVEVLSPSTQLKDRNTKFEIYEENGVKYYIMINPENESVEIFQLIDNRYKEVNIDTFVLSKTCTVLVDFDSLFE